MMMVNDGAIRDLVRKLDEETMKRLTQAVQTISEQENEIDVHFAQDRKQ